VPIPRVIEEACDNCGACAGICQYSAIVCLGDKPLVFPELCHGCGGCVLVCPRRAIVEEARVVGLVERGRADAVQFVHGLLNVGEAMSPPVIRAVRQAAPPADYQILDAPPGTSCPMMTAVRGCDYVLLVTEPTPFGLNDLTLAVETTRKLGLPFGVAINRSDAGDDRVVCYCRSEGIPVLLELPEDRRIAEAYSRGELAVDAVPGIASSLTRLLERIQDAYASTSHEAQRGSCNANV
jgi:MinD superfamily P-loop ATPase